jgi:hypothetical protein
MLLGHLRHGRLVRLAQDLDHLLFRKSCLLHGPLASRRAIVPKYQLDRKSTSRSDQPGNDGVITSVLAEQPDSWRIINKKDGHVVLKASWKLSQDGNTLTDNFASFAADGSPAVSLRYVYKRTDASPGSGFAGTWESTSQVMDSTFLLNIQPYQGDGLSIIIPAQNQTENVKFDGKDHPNVASGRRTNEHSLEIEKKSEGKITRTQQLELSSDHKTLSLTVYAAGRSEPNNILVFDRQ